MELTAILIARPSVTGAGIAPSDPRMNELWSSFILFFPFLKYQSSGLVCGVAADTQGPERPLHPACDFPIEFFPDFTSSSG